MSTAELSVLFMCCCTVVADLYLIYVSWRKSPLGPIVALVILQILLGTAVVPIAIAAGLYGGSFHGNQYLLQNDPPGIAAAAHLGLFSIGGIVGWHFGARSGFCRRAVTILSRPLLKLDAFRCAVCLLILSFGCYAILFIQIDWTVLLSNARGGSRDAYGESHGYLFLKSMASVGMWSVCLLPSILRYCNRRKIVFIAALILLYVCLTFVIAVSRNLLLWSILLPAIVLVRYSGVSRLVKCLAAMVVVVSASGVLLYGKSFSQVQRRLVSSGEWSSLESSSPEGLAVSVISNLDFQWFAVDAGIKNFLAGGPMPVAEVGLAMAIGYVPSRMLESVGLGSLSYVSYGDEGIVPIN